MNGVSDTICLFLSRISQGDQRQSSTSTGFGWGRARQVVHLLSSKFYNTLTTKETTTDSKRNDCWPAKMNRVQKRKEEGYVSEWTRFNFVSTRFSLPTCPLLHFACWTAWTQLAYVMDDDKCDEVFKMHRSWLMFFVCFCLSGKMGAKKCQSNFSLRQRHEGNEINENKKNQLYSCFPIIAITWRGEFDFLPHLLVISYLFMWFWTATFWSRSRRQYPLPFL